ncbi:MAG: HhH-GPD-type base excision DNA repair protein [Actinomycetota bacterium]|nr:HhH-GPD-type base excision DNA repair protein [Actinomycetota bacterium]
MGSPLCFTGDAKADALLNENSLALLIGMLLDQQFPIERAFLSPFRLQQRLGRPLDAIDLANIRAEKLVQIFSEKPALHRFPKSMAQRTQKMCCYLADHYNGDASGVWANLPDALSLQQRLLEIPGFGEKKVKIFVALLAKRFGVAPQGWEKISGHYSTPGFHSVADLDSPEALSQLRAVRAAAKTNP